MIVERCTREKLDDWVRLRQGLWPDAAEPEHRFEAAAMLDRVDDAVAYLVFNDASTVIAFAEATLRRDYVNGCTTSPVGFLEGLYVHPDWRKLGVARLLYNAVEDWAVGLSCSELASDADIDNEASHKMHNALGFDETERVVFYRKRLTRE